MCFFFSFLFIQLSNDASAFMLMRSKHIKGPNERCLLEQDKHLHILGVIPFVKLQNDTDSFLYIVLYPDKVL